MDLVQIIKQIILQALNSNLYNKDAVYAFTNENIAGYLESQKIEKSAKVLSICSGGDHLLNLGVKNVLNVDLVDTNPMTEYFTLGIKIPLVLAYSFEEFKLVLDFLFKSRNYDLKLEREILYSLLPLMNLKYKMFFKEIFDYYFSLQEQYHGSIKLMQILTTDYYFNMDEITFYNLYLQSESNYNTLRNMILKMNISFRQVNIFAVNENNTYDLVLCSNAIEHTYTPDCDINKLKMLFLNLNSSLKNDGVIMATYIYSFYSTVREEYKSFPINGTDITDRELLKEELIMIDSYRKDKDAVLVLRK